MSSCGGGEGGALLERWAGGALLEGEDGDACVEVGAEMLEVPVPLPIDIQDPS